MLEPAQENVVDVNILAQEIALIVVVVLVVLIVVVLVKQIVNKLVGEIVLVDAFYSVAMDANKDVKVLVPVDAQEPA